MMIEEQKALAAAYARGEIQGEERERLVGSVESLHTLRDALTTLASDIEAQFLERKADAGEFKNECYVTGDKAGWFEYKAQYDAWRAGARRFKMSVDAAKREVSTQLTATPHDPGVNRALRQENHLLRTALALTLEPRSSLWLDADDLEAADAPWASLEKHEDEYEVRINYRQGDDE